MISRYFDKYFEVFWSRSKVIPSLIFTGLQLYRMLQKHYQLHDNKDMVPGLQWNSVMKIKCAIIRLLTQCNQSCWWIYGQGLCVNPKTIINALNSKSKYLLYDDNNKFMIDNNEIIIGDNDSNNDNNDDENKEYLERLNKKYVEFMNE